MLKKIGAGRRRMLRGRSRKFAIGLALALVLGIVGTAYAEVYGDPFGAVAIGTTSNDNPSAWLLAVGNGGTATGYNFCFIECSPTVAVNTTGSSYSYNYFTGVSISGTGYAGGASVISISGTGDTGVGALIGISGTGNSAGTLAASGTGNTTGVLAVSGTKNATGSALVITGLGDAKGESYGVIPVVVISGTGNSNSNDYDGAGSIAISGAGCANANGGIEIDPACGL